MHEIQLEMNYMNFNYQNQVSNILSCGLLCSSPFGRSVKFRFFDFGGAQTEHESLLIRNSNREISSTVKLSTAPASNQFKIVAPVGMTDTGRNSSVKIRMIVVGTDSNGVSFQDNVVGIGQNQIQTTQSRTMTQGDLVKFIQPPQTKEYIVSMNLKMLFLDEEDMKEV